MNTKRTVVYDSISQMDPGSIMQMRPGNLKGYFHRYGFQPVLEDIDTAIDTYSKLTSKQSSAKDVVENLKSLREYFLAYNDSMGSEGDYSEGLAECLLEGELSLDDITLEEKVK